MSVVNINIPSTDKAYYTKAESSKVNTILKSIESDYGNIINNTSNITSVPKNLIKSIIYTESNGKASLESSAGAVGIMQVKPSTANDIIVIAKNKKRLNQLEKDVLFKTLDVRLAQILKLPYAGKANYVTKADLKNVEFCIMVGSLMLKLILAEETKSTGIRLDNVLLRYNRGFFYKNKAKSFEESLSLHKNKPEAYNYLLKVAGKNGTLDLLT